MAVVITISGDSAGDALEDLKTLADSLATPIVRPVWTNFIKRDNVAETPEEVKVHDGLENVAETPEEVISDTDVPPSSEVDSAGVPFDPVLHTGTLKKDGTWRMRKGAVAVEAVSEPEAPSESAEPAGEETAPAADTSSDDDEFAVCAFAAAAAKIDEDAPTEIPERKWTDADVGAISNQAAQKLGNAAAVKEVIAQFVPEGQVAHSRNIPVDKRAAFAEALEKKAGINFAG